MLKDFKNFILRGNVIDLAVGIVVGSAFTAIVTSLVKDMITPLIAAVYKTSSFDSDYFTLRHSKFMYGNFVNACVSFLIIACVIFFLVVRPVNKLTAINKRRHAPEEPNTKQCPECLSSIPKSASRCMYCTIKVK
jgi:large conductance mechanosensitive channel